MKNDAVLQLLGLAAKGRNVLSGEFSTEKAVKTGNANLVIIAVDASDNTKKLFGNMCAFYKVQFYEYGTKEELGHCIGKRYRASLAITDVGLAKAVEEKIKSSKTIE